PATERSRQGATQYRQHSKPPVWVARTRAVRAHSARPAAREALSATARRRVAGAGRVVATDAAVRPDGMDVHAGTDGMGLNPDKRELTARRVQSALTAASTSAACPSTFTFRHSCASVPLLPIRNVLRSIP